MNDLSINERLLSVTDGGQTIGFIINRGKTGVEAFTANEESIGVFENVPAAATASATAAALSGSKRRYSSSRKRARNMKFPEFHR